jgi:hypothetical protein
MSAKDSSTHKPVVSGHAFARLYDFKIPSQLHTKAARVDGMSLTRSCHAADVPATANKSAPIPIHKLIPHSIPPGPTIIPTTVIETLIMANQDVWTLFLDNQFCSEAYISSVEAFNSKFKSYSKV